ncbi:MAG: hypothetical protein HY695_32630 [Deltaproteobacteria bacterium]|nr:hypothetical protein [Deltaproteobacteria bacterium]
MQSSEPNHDARDHAPPGHELSDLSPRTIVFFAIGLVVMIGLAVVITGLLMYDRGARYAKRQTPGLPLAWEREAMTGPRLQVDPQKELRDMRAGEDTALNTYQWVDRDAGIVKIPIERAMEILAEKMSK